MKTKLTDIMVKRIYFSDRDYIQHINDLRDEVEGLRSDKEELLSVLRAIRLELEYDMPRPAAKKMWAGADQAIKKAEAK